MGVGAALTVPCLELWKAWEGLCPEQQCAKHYRCAIKRRMRCQPQIWLVILRYLAGFMAWMTILLVNAALVGLTLYCFVMSGLLGSDSFRQVSRSMYCVM